MAFFSSSGFPWGVFHTFSFCLWDGHSAFFWTQEDDGTKIKYDFDSRWDSDEQEPGTSSDVQYLLVLHTPVKGQVQNRGSWGIFTSKLSRITYYLGDLFPKSLMVRAL